MRKKLILLCLSAILTIGLCACSDNTPTWQEQYDLGIRYLSEGNYQEAIIAFTAAIEIDPKQALAYVGRGDAYVGSGEIEENLFAAQADYEKAIELDKTLAEVYIKLADVYIRQGDEERALEILRQGADRTGDPAILEKLSELDKPEELPEPENQVGTEAGTIAIGGFGHNMQLSLTWPDLPEEIWCDGDALTAFRVYISDGRQTFWIETYVHSGFSERMASIPLGPDCENRLWVLALDYFDVDTVVGFFSSAFGIDIPVSANREANTITWNFEMPEAGFSVADIQYAGYELSYKNAPDSEQVQEHATFKVQQGNLIYLNNGVLSDLEFGLSSGECVSLYNLPITVGPIEVR